ncbi:MAG: hypothetical protein Q7Q73_15170 [Verrucomicrobiota bacterium JB024]|nr:hypothetical protein [Verrucomicrobiota bacterium JB024]
MTFSIGKNTFIGMILCLGALLFAAGATSPDASTGIRWTVTGVDSTCTSAYVIDQQTGDIYYLEKNQNISSRKIKLTRVGNMRDAR